MLKYSSSNCCRVAKLNTQNIWKIESKLSGTVRSLVFFGRNGRTNTWRGSLRNTTTSVQSASRLMTCGFLTWSSQTCECSTIDYRCITTCTPWGRKKGTSFLLCAVLSTWQKLVNFFTYIRTKESRSIICNSMYVSFWRALRILQR